MPEEVTALRKNMILTLGMWLLFGLGALIIMLYVAAHKTIVITDVGRDEAYLLRDHSDEVQSESAERSEYVLPVAYDRSMPAQLTVPLPGNLTAESVEIENHYLQNELWIHMKGVTEDFYKNKSVISDKGYAEAAFYEVLKDETVLKLHMSGIYEYVSTMEEDRLVMNCRVPSEVFEMIVVVDPVWENTEAGFEKDGLQESATPSYDPLKKGIVLNVAKSLQQMENVDSFKIYFTRLNDSEMTDPERSKLAQRLNADLYVELSVSEDQQDPQKYGICAYYNEEFYIPGFGNVQWADALARNVAIASSNRAVGLYPAKEDDVISRLDIPAARIALGFVTNESENQLMQQDEYVEKLAQGILNAITEALEQ